MYLTFIVYTVIVLLLNTIKITKPNTVYSSYHTIASSNPDRSATGFPSPIYNPENVENLTFFLHPVVCQQWILWISARSGQDGTCPTVIQQIHIHIGTEGDEFNGRLRFHGQNIASAAPAATGANKWNIARGFSWGEKHLDWASSTGESIDWLVGLVYSLETALLQILRWYVYLFHLFSIEEFKG